MYKYINTKGSVCIDIPIIFTEPFTNNELETTLQ